MRIRICNTVRVISMFEHCWYMTKKVNKIRHETLFYVVVLLCRFCYITIAGCVDIGYLIVFRR